MSDPEYVCPHCGAGFSSPELYYSHTAICESNPDAAINQAIGAVKGRLLDRHTSGEWSYARWNEVEVELNDHIAAWREGQVTDEEFATHLHDFAEKHLGAEATA